MTYLQSHKKLGLKGAKRHFSINSTFTLDIKTKFAYRLYKTDAYLKLLTPDLTDLTSTAVFLRWISFGAYDLKGNV